MEVILEFLANVPTWIYVVFGIVLVFVFFGDRGLWDFEVKFPFQSGVGRAEIDFEAYKKRGKVISAKFELEPRMNNKSIEIFLRDRSVLTIPATANQKKRVFTSQEMDYPDPNEGDEVTVEIGGEVVFEGQLVKD